MCRRPLDIVLFFCLCFVQVLSAFSLKAQCSSPISSFPYNEDFETGPGNWIVGGNFPSWALGTPAKSTIGGAGSGNRCWITGGLTATAYSDNENSWIQSPCFDLRSLSNPEISFRVFWETERQYDGAQIMYSIDEGVSWNILGTENSNASCAGSNWYNSNSVQFLGFRPGWSGNVQTGGGNCLNGQGSGQWLSARHSLSVVQGQSKVLFRVFFASGNICNQFDGFAIDDIRIQEAQPNSAGISYTCLPALTLNFTALTGTCPAAYSWNFDDPASGAFNTSGLPNPQHIFSAPGTYRVRLTVSYNTGPAVDANLDITVFSAAVNQTSVIRCYGESTGSAVIIPQPFSASYQYSWNTSPVQNSVSASGLSAGQYQATVSIPNGCSISFPVQISQPDSLYADIMLKDEQCLQKNGMITVDVTGGTAPYQLRWPDGTVGFSFSNLESGNYWLEITDAQGCRKTITDLTIQNKPMARLPVLIRDTAICPGQILRLNPGDFARYLWQNGSSLPELLVNESGLYVVTVTDSLGCKASDSTRVVVDCRDIYFPTAFTPDGNGLNDTFGPLGDIRGLRYYQLEVFNRWGELIFSGKRPEQKWDGRFKGLPVESQTCVWLARFIRPGRKTEYRKGTVMVIR